MKGFDLLKGMGYIDDDIAGEALDAQVEAKLAQEKKAGFAEKLKGFFFGRSAGRWVAAAACLAIAVYAGWGITQNSKDAAPQASGPMYMSDSAKNAESNEYFYAGAAEAEEDVMEDAQVELSEADEPRETEPAEAAPAAETAEAAEPVTEAAEAAPVESASVEEPKAELAEAAAEPKAESAQEEPKAKESAKRGRKRK